MANKPTVAVDVDGTLASYHGWQGVESIGDPLPGAVDFTHKLSQFAHILIYTTRTKVFENGAPDPTGAPAWHRSSPDYLVGLVKAWLDKWGFAYDEIYSGQGKPYATAYVDDRAVECMPQRFGAEEYDTALEGVRLLIQSSVQLSPTLKKYLGD